MNLVYRPRRLRTGDGIRRLVRGTRISTDSLIYPMFVTEGKGVKEEISSMPGQYRYSVDMLPEILGPMYEAGVKSVLFFGIPSHKDEIGSGAYDPEGAVQRGFREAKRLYPDMYLIGDICMCEYTSHGHCGILHGDYVDNDETLEALAKAALSHIEAGADMVAPSDMMDGRVGYIRQTLDENGYINAPIMSYAAKFASGFYGPFREAADSAPAFGDRRSYQMDFHNGREALREMELDIEEGADIIMIKPAMAYGDLISDARDMCDLPIATYSVSGEYSMIRAAGLNGWADEKRLYCEAAVSAYRAGADIYISYFAQELAQAIKAGDIG